MVYLGLFHDWTNQIESLSNLMCLHDLVSTPFTKVVNRITQINLID